MLCPHAASLIVPHSLFDEINRQQTFPIEEIVMPTDN